MESMLNELGTNQRHATRGIFILCKAVGELMQGSNIASQQELLEFTKHPFWQQGSRVPVTVSQLACML
jgi:hypothetical protein